MTWVFRRPTDYRVKPSRLFAIVAAASATGGIADLAIGSTGSLSGTGALEGTASITLESDSAPSVNAPLEATSALLVDATATLGGISAVAGTAALTLASNATISVQAASAFQRVVKYAKWTRPPYDNSYQANRMVVFPLTEPTGILGQADISFTPVGVLRGTAAVAASADLAFDGLGLLSGAGSLVGTAGIAITPTALATGVASGAMAASAALLLDTSGSVLGAGSLAGSADLVMGASMVTSFVQQISGDSALTIAALGDLRDFAGTGVVKTIVLDVRYRTKVLVTIDNA